jgi:hypothetical protein
MPLEMDGVISRLTTRKPTDSELKDCTFFVATSSAKWDPYSDRFRQAEDAINATNPRKKRGLSAISSSDLPTMIYDDEGDIPRIDRYHMDHIYDISMPRNLSTCSSGGTNIRVYQHLVTTEGNDPNFDEKVGRVRVINSLHTSLYEAPYSDGAGKSELAIPGTDVVNISSVQRGYNPNMDYSKRLKLEIPIHESLEERYIDRRNRWGPGNTVPGTRGGLSPKELAKRWHISEQRAAETIKVTTQKGVRNLSNPLTRRLKTQRWHNKRYLRGKWFSDTMHFKDRSITRQEKAAQVFTNGSGFITFFPIQREATCSDGLMRMVNEIGVPERLIVDGARAQGSHETYNTHWQKIVKSNGIQQTWIQPHCWWQNLAEKSIGELRKEMRYLQSSKTSPKRLWGYLGAYVASKKQRTASNIPSNMGRTPYEVVHGYTPDISLYIIHDWYDYIWWYDLGDKTEKLGRWLGPSGEKFGGGDCHYVLFKSGKIRVTNSTRPVTEDEWKQRDILRQMDEADASITEKIGDEVPMDRIDHTDGEPLASESYDEDDSPWHEDPLAAMPDADEYTPEQYDEYVGSEVLLPVGSELLRGVVKKRHHDLNGNPYGLRNSNPILDTRSYDVQLPDGSIGTYGANILAENIMSSVDDEGNLFVLMDEIIQHRKTKEALVGEDGWYITKTGTRRRKPTTKGWELLISWKDGTSSWTRLADIKESFPLEVAEYVKGVGILDEPAFAWWCYEVLRRKKRHISGAKTKYWLKTHKYGVRLPKSIEEALRLDRETGTDLWAKAIAKEMKNVMVTFEFDDQDRIPVGHQKVTVHMVFDVKITLQRKARLVADGHKVPESRRESTYSSVPSRDSVRLFFLLLTDSRNNTMVARRRSFELCMDYRSPEHLSGHTWRYI